MRKSIRQIISIVLISGILLMSMTGCGGRSANPVQVSQINDYDISCNQIKTELSQIQYRIRQKTGQKNAGDGKDTALFVTGMILFWPALFFMDLSNADKVELDAMQARYNHLTGIYNSKCN